MVSSWVFRGMSADAMLVPKRRAANAPAAQVLHRAYPLLIKWSFTVVPNPVLDHACIRHPPSVNNPTVQNPFGEQYIAEKQR